MSQLERAAQAVDDALAPLLGQSPNGPDATAYAVARAVLAVVAPEKYRCPKCGVIGGGHGLVHTRHPEGGGGTNTPCPLTPAPRTVETVDELKALPVGSVVADGDWCIFVKRQLDNRTVRWESDGQMCIRPEILEFGPATVLYPHPAPDVPTEAPCHHQNAAYLAMISERNAANALLAEVRAAVEALEASVDLTPDAYDTILALLDAKAGE